MTNKGDVVHYKKDFWAVENPKYGKRHFRLEKMGRLVNRLAPGECHLLDVGCGPATLRELLRPGIDYYGIDIAIGDPAPHLLECDILLNPIGFEGKRFDVVVAQGLFEYLGEHQSEKFAEIAQILEPGGLFLTTYVNFEHRKPEMYWPYSNVQRSADFRRVLEEHFVVDRQFPTSLNWRHNEPNRAWLRRANMSLSVNIPLVGSQLAVEYFYVCSPRGRGKG